jgi:hypothetical protein
MAGKTTPDGSLVVPGPGETPDFPKRVNPLVRSYTQDALDGIAHELERRHRDGEQPADWMEYCRRRDEFYGIQFKDVHGLMPQLGGTIAVELSRKIAERRASRRKAEGERLAEITRLIALKYR